MQAEHMISARIGSIGNTQAAGPLATTGRMRVVCSWCRSELPAKACEPARDGAVSHGICTPCRNAMLADEGLAPPPAD